MQKLKINFSIIIPCYNTSKKFINRLLESLTRQGIDKNQLQVIIVDDQSEDKDFLNEAKNFEDKLNIVYTETKENYHTPANTREAGLSLVTGDWLCFCDHDDIYEDNALSQIEAYIQEHNPPFAICGNMRSWDENTDTFQNYIHKLAWLHGKFYNMEHLIKPYNIHFYKDIVTHEDIGWNCQCQAVMYELNTDFSYADIMIYRWINEPTSISRKPTEGRGYLYEHLNDYIKAASEPFFKGAKIERWWFVNQLMMTLLHCYFYYIGAIYNQSSDLFKDNLQIIQKYCQKIIKELNISYEDIIDFIMEDPKKYQTVRNDCMEYTGFFIEKVSFSDFIKKIIKEEDFKK